MLFAISDVIGDKRRRRLKRRARATTAYDVVEVADAAVMQHRTLRLTVGVLSSVRRLCCRSLRNGSATRLMGLRALRHPSAPRAEA